MRRYPRAPRGLRLGAVVKASQARRPAAPAAKRHPLICRHEWVIAANGAEYAELCVDCGAGCTRDKDTRKIVAFDARLPEAPMFPRGARR